MDKSEFRKLVQVLAFFALKNGKKIDKLKAIKLLFFADRYHVRKYGRPVVWTNYVAMDFGPVSSEALDLINDVVQGRTFLRKNLNTNYGYLAKDSENSYKVVKEVDESAFEESELEALIFAWDTFGNFSGGNLIDFTHVYPEWKKYESFFKDTYGSRKDIDLKDIDLKDFFKDPPQKERIFEKLKGKTDPFKNVKSDFAERELNKKLALRKVENWKKTDVFLRAKESFEKMKREQNFIEGNPVPKIFVENQLKVLKSKDC